MSEQVIWIATKIVRFSPLIIKTWSDMLGRILLQCYFYLVIFESEKGFNK